MDFIYEGHLRSKSSNSSFRHRILIKIRFGASYLHPQTLHLNNISSSSIQTASPKLVSLQQIYHLVFFEKSILLSPCSLLEAQFHTKLRNKKVTEERHVESKSTPALSIAELFDYNLMILILRHS